MKPLRAHRRSHTPLPKRRINTTPTLGPSRQYNAESFPSDEIVMLALVCALLFAIGLLVQELVCW